MLLAGELPGFAPQGQRTVGTSAQSWVIEQHYPASEQEKERHRLEGLGFVRAVGEHLAPSAENGPEAISIAVQFRSPRSASSNIEHEIKTTEAHGAKPFAVVGVPGAKGFGGVTGATTGYNVAFAIGPYYYLVGEGYPTGAPGAPTREQLVTAAQRLYARMHK